MLSQCRRWQQRAQRTDHDGCERRLNFVGVGGTLRVRRQISRVCLPVMKSARLRFAENSSLTGSATLPWWFSPRRIEEHSTGQRDRLPCSRGQLRVEVHWRRLWNVLSHRTHLWQMCMVLVDQRRSRHAATQIGLAHRQESSRLQRPITGYECLVPTVVELLVTSGKTRTPSLQRTKLMASLVAGYESAVDFDSPTHGYSSTQHDLH